MFVAVISGASEQCPGWRGGGGPYVNDLFGASLECSDDRQGLVDSLHLIGMQGEQRKWCPQWTFGQ